MTINIYISNISEDVWSFIQSMHDAERIVEMDENAYLSDRELLTLPRGMKNIAILPTNCQKEIIPYLKELFGDFDVEVLIPQKHTGEICRDIRADTKILGRLMDLGRQADFRVTSYSATAQMYELISHLRNIGLTVATPEAPDESEMWTVDYFGSKSGIRQTADKLQTTDNPWMGKGFIVTGIRDVASLAASIYCHGNGVVLKTNKAHAGAGVKIFKKDSLPSIYIECREKIEEILKQEKYWQFFPVVVEDILDVDLGLAGGNPNCEYYVTGDGDVKLLYVCGMRITPDGVFKGVEIHNDVLPEDIIKRLLYYGEHLGRIYTESGYAGYFDVDCIYTKDKKLFITESNVRRTGATHVYHTALKLIGDNFMENSFILSNNNYALPKEEAIEIKELFEKLRPILFDKRSKTGLVLASTNGLKHGFFGYIIFGENSLSAHKIEEEMERLLIG